MRKKHIKFFYRKNNTSHVNLIILIYITNIIPIYIANINNVKHYF